MSLAFKITDNNETQLDTESHTESHSVGENCANLHNVCLYVFISHKGIFLYR